MKNKMMGLLLAAMICSQVQTSQRSRMEKINAKITNLRHIIWGHPKISLIMMLFLGYNLFVPVTKAINAKLHNKLVDNENKVEKDKSRVLNVTNKIMYKVTNKTTKKDKESSIKEAYKESVEYQKGIVKNCISNILGHKLFYGGLLASAAIVSDNKEMLNNLTQSFSDNPVTTGAIAMFGTYCWNKLAEDLTKEKSDEMNKCFNNMNNILNSDNIKKISNMIKRVDLDDEKDIANDDFSNKRELI